MVRAAGITNFNAGVVGVRRHLTTFIMALAVALLITLIVEFDRPYRGLIQVPAQALVDAAQSIPR